MMHVLRSRFLRLAVVLAVVLTLSTSGAAGADTYHGQHADHVFLDGSTATPGATCIYTFPAAELKQLIVRPPSLWWPDTVAEKHHEHGTVGWRVIVRTSQTPVTGPFNTAYRSPIQKATAYEDQDVPYGDATKAHLTRRTVEWNHARHGHTFVQVIVQAFWFAKDGSVKGWVKHPVVFLRYRYGTSTDFFTNWCNNEGLAG